MPTFINITEINDDRECRKFVRLFVHHRMILKVLPQFILPSEFDQRIVVALPTIFISGTNPKYRDI